MSSQRTNKQQTQLQVVPPGIHDRNHRKTRFRRTLCSKVRDQCSELVMGTNRIERKRRLVHGPDASLEQRSGVRKQQHASSAGNVKEV